MAVRRELPELEHCIIEKPSRQPEILVNPLPPGASPVFGKVAGNQNK